MYARPHIIGIGIEIKGNNVIALWAKSPIS